MKHFKFQYMIILLYVFALGGWSIGCQLPDSESSPNKSNSTNGGTDNPATDTGEFTLTSTSFDNDGELPIELAHTSLGGSAANEFPQLSWSNPPEGTTHYAISMIDTKSQIGNALDSVKNYLEMLPGKLT